MISLINLKYTEFDSLWTGKTKVSSLHESKAQKKVWPEKKSGKHQFVDANSSYRSIRDCQGGVYTIGKDKDHRQHSNNGQHLTPGEREGNQERKG